MNFEIEYKLLKRQSESKEKRIKELESAIQEFVDAESITDNMPDAHHLMRETGIKFKQLLGEKMNFRKSKTCHNCRFNDHLGHCTKHKELDQMFRIDINIHLFVCDDFQHLPPKKTVIK